MSSTDDTEFTSWITYGVTKGWVSLPVCVAHSPLPMQPEEESVVVFSGELDDEEVVFMEDPCMFALRVWKDFDADDRE